MVVKMAVDGCDKCPALCCSDLEESINRPRTELEVNNLKWELHFSNTRVFIRSKRWYTLTLGRCKYLDKDDRCTIYEDRPEVCRDHMPPACERYGDIYDVMFEDPEDLQKHIDKEKRKAKRKRAKKKAK